MGISKSDHETNLHVLQCLSPDHEMDKKILERSPRWTSGSPRMLLVWVREFESRRGEILNFFAKKKKDQLLRAPSVGKHNATRVDEGRAEISSR